MDIQRYISNKNFLQTTQVAKSLVHNLEKSKLANLKKDLQSKITYLKKQTLFSNSKKACEDLAEKTADLYTAICFVQMQSFKPSKPRRGHKEPVKKENSKERKERHFLKGIETEKQLKETVKDIKKQGIKIVTPHIIKQAKDKKYAQATGHYGGPRKIGVDSKKTELYTPPDIIKRVTAVMGSIDLDPASCKEANKIVKAKKFFTQKEDGLTKPWYGNVWLNPPYIYKKTDCYIDKFCTDNIKAGIIIMNNNTEVAWAQKLLSVCNIICFPKGRIAFYKNSKEAYPQGGLQGQMICGRGVDIKKFEKHFCDVGAILYPSPNQASKILKTA